jgi:hypothetical protein
VHGVPYEERGNTIQGHFRIFNAARLMTGHDNIHCTHHAGWKLVTSGRIATPQRAEGSVKALDTVLCYSSEREESETLLRVIQRQREQTQLFMYPLESSIQ